MAFVPSSWLGDVSLAKKSTAEIRSHTGLGIEQLATQGEDHVPRLSRRGDTGHSGLWISACLFSLIRKGTVSLFKTAFLNQPVPSGTQDGCWHSVTFLPPATPFPGDIARLKPLPGELPGKERWPSWGSSLPYWAEGHEPDKWRC